MNYNIPNTGRRMNRLKQNGLDLFETTRVRVNMNISFVQDGSTFCCKRADLNRSKLSWEARSSQDVEDVLEEFWWWRLLAVYISSGRRCWNSRPGGRTVWRVEIVFSQGYVVDCLKWFLLPLMWPYSRVRARNCANTRNCARFQIFSSLPESCQDNYLCSIYLWFPPK